MVMAVLQVIQGYIPGMVHYGFNWVQILMENQLVTDLEVLYPLILMAID